MRTFITSTGKRVSGSELQAALDTLARFWRDTAHAIYEGDEYASHVPERVKLDKLAEMLAHGDAVQQGRNLGFTDLQRLNYYITGEDTPLLPPAA